MGDFTKLKVWKLAKDLTVEIYKLTNHPKWKNDFRFISQIRSAALSVPSNIAEGDESGTNKNSVRYFYIAKGSTAEVITQLIVAKDIGYVEETKFNELLDKYNQLSAMLRNLIKARTNG